MAARLALACLLATSVVASSIRTRVRDLRVTGLRHRLIGREREGRRVLRRRPAAGKEILSDFENEATAGRPSDKPAPGREILFNFDDEATDNTVRVANRAFNSQASDASIDMINKATSDYGPYKEPSERVNEVLVGLTRRKGEGVSGRRRKLVKVKHLRPNEVNEVEVSSKQWKRGKLRRKVLRPPNTEVARLEVKHNVKNGEGLSRV